MNDNRLAALASFVRVGTVTADVGTDHGKLAVLLIRDRQAAHVYATDINEKPLRKAEQFISLTGLTEQITPILTDGLIGLSHLPIQDIVIAGMGGELISQIIEKSDFRKKGVRFVLQPMSRPEALRLYLSQNGFFFVEETLVEENGRVYPILVSEFDGRKKELSPLEQLVGPCLLKKHCELPSSLFHPYLQSKINNQKKVLEGKVSRNLDASDDKRLLHELEMLFSQLPNEGDPL